MLGTILIERWRYLRTLWRERLWSKWLGGLYGAAGVFIFVRDEFWRPPDTGQWALVKLLPRLTLTQWVAGALLLLLVWAFEAGFRINTELMEKAKETKQVRSPEEERKFRAARAMLPATLDSIFVYATASARWLKGVREKARLLEAGQYKTAVAVPTSPRPDALMHQIRDGIEKLDTGVSDWLSEILRKVQIQRARISDLEDYFDTHISRGPRVGLVRNIDQSVADSVELAALARQLFPYARNQSDEAIEPLDIDVVQAAFRECHLDLFQDVDAWNILSTPYLTQSSRLVDFALEGAVDAED